MIVGRGALDAGGGDTAEATAFIARTSGLDATHISAYKALINGLVGDGIYSKFDLLFIFATADTTTALLNLPSATYAASITNTPNFTADSGYIGSVGTGGVTTNFNPSTAGSPQFVQNSAHVSAWNVTNTNGPNPLSQQTDSASLSLYPKLTSDSKLYIRVNDNSASAGFTIGTPTGLLLGNRSGSTAREAYQNGSATLDGGTVATYGSVASKAVTSSVMVPLLNNAPYRIAAFSAGASLNASEQLAYYNRMRTYMTAVGVP